MRLWSLHPVYLDRMGLTAVWREALLAQAVLQGRTRGYLRHPQLMRFRQVADPGAAIAAYLRGIAHEAELRGYRFNQTLILSEADAEQLTVTAGQLRYEREHLRRKLVVRAPQRLAVFGEGLPAPHPLFRVIDGDLEVWEIVGRG